MTVCYLLAFFSPTVRSLRCIEDMSQLPKVNRHLGVAAVCKSTLSDANALFDPALLAPLIADLRRKLPNLRQHADGGGELERLLDDVVLVDGSHFALLAEVAWAMRSANHHAGSAGSSVRLNCQFSLRGGVPVGASVNGRDGVGEGAAAIPFVEPGVTYLFDGGVVSFAYLDAILGAGSRFLCNLAPGVNFTVTRDVPLADADRAAGVTSDRVGRLTGSDARVAPAAELREVRVAYVDRDGNPRTLRLLTDLLALPARLVAEMYRHRWRIEIFFRWLKVHANFEHLVSHSRHGITTGFYVAVIAAMLMCLQTQRELSKYGYNLIGMVAAGLGDVADVLPLLENRERERQRDRDRQARAQAAKLAAKKSA